MAAAPVGYDQAVSSWAAHLRSGGTTAWHELAPPDSPVPALAPLPDAPHLELVRRLNLAAGPLADTLGPLADQVWATGSPGRGRVDVPLAWPGRDHRYGSPPTEPERLPSEELLRLATGVLVDLLPGVPIPEAEAGRRRLPLPWRRRFRLHGSPGTVAVVRRALTDRGLVESDWRPVHVVVGRPVELMMGELWDSATRRGGALRWSTWWRRARAAGRLPHQLDLPALAGDLARGGEPVHVVLAQTVEGAVAGAATALGATGARVPPGRPYDAVETDLLRRLNRIAPLRGTALPSEQLAERLSSVLAGPAAVQRPDPVACFRVPRGARAWLRETATASAARLAEDGYAVHGDPDVLGLTEPRHRGQVDPGRTLELAVAACLLSWWAQEGRP